MALALALFAPASSLAAPSDTCPPDTALTPAYEFDEVGVKVPLVATHELTIFADFSDRVRAVTLSAPEGVRVISTSGPRMKLIVPVSASLAVTATWIQANGPSGDPYDPETNCTATVTTALPITATRPTRAYYLRKGADSYTAFAVAKDPQRGDVSPMEISIRVAASTRFPSARAKQRKMPVAMRPSERVRYRKHIPQEEFATSPLRCRYYHMTCGVPALVSSWATALMWPGRTIRPRHLNGGALLSYVQPFRIVAPYGVVVDALVGGRTDYKPRASSYDIQVHQSGELVGRARVAVRCGRERTQFGEYFYRCHAVRRKFG